MEPIENFEISSLEDLFENAKMTAPTTDLDKYENALYHEIFIKEEYAIAKPIIKKAKTILDIWGHIGLFSERCLHLNPKVHIHYFEPFECLVKKAKARLQSFSSQITFNPFWIAKTAWAYEFLLNERKTMQSSQHVSFLNPKGKLEKVECKNLNHYLKDQKIWKIDLLKLDIEGMEFEVLFDIQEENREKIEAILCEIHLLSSTDEENFPILISLLKSHFAHVERNPSPYSEKIWLCFCYKKE